MSRAINHPVIDPQVAFIIVVVLGFVYVYAVFVLFCFVRSWFNPIEVGKPE